MSNKLHITKKSLLSLILSVILALSMAACGSGEEDRGPDWVYVPEFLTGEDLENISWYNAGFVGDSLYYTGYNWDMETETSYTTLNRYSILDGAKEEIILPLPERANIDGWAVGEDGSLYAALTIYNWNETTGASTQTYMLAKYDAQGNEVFLYDFTESILSDSRNSYINGLAVDGQGRSYVMANSLIWLFDAEGNPAGTLNINGGMDSWLNGYCRGSDGKVWVTVTTYDGNGSSTALSSVNFESKSLEDDRSGFPSGSSMTQDAEGRFLLHDGTTVFVYDPNAQETEELFDWLDCDINGNYVRSFGALSDGRIIAAYEDWQNDDSGIALMTRTSADEVTPKQQIVIGVMYQDYDLSGAVVSFNKSSDTYRISIRQYVDYDSDWETRMTDALNRLNADITSNNCPDILSLSGLNIQQLAAKGVFEDLSPYLEQSSGLDRDDMLENVLDAFTFDGVLIAIPDSFQLDTIVGSAAEVGEEMGWTLSDMIAYADAHPGTELFDNTDKSDIIKYCLTYNISNFVDWQTGTCDFDSDEFKNLLEFVNRFPDEVTYEEGRPSTPTRIQNGEVLLYRTYVSNIDDVQFYAEMFGGDVTFIGYPNSDGSSGCNMSPNGAYAITARSDVKEGAWDFIEGYLTRENTMYRFGYPNSKSELKSMAEDAVKVEYFTDENGDPILDENGEPFIIGGSHGVGYGDFWYDYRIATQEEVDMVLELLESARLGSDSNDQIMAIILEEAEAFFQGQKPVEEVTRIIQNRVKNYVSENS